MALVEKFKRLMSSEFEMSLIGKLSFFLGLQITQKDKGTEVHQQKYLRELLKKFQLNDCKPVSTPISLQSHLRTEPSSEKVEGKIYRGMIGSLMYLTASRPNIVLVVCLCARFQ